MISFISRVKDRYFNPQYPFRDRLYFLFGTAGVISAGAAYLAAIFSGLPWIAAAASLTSFFIMLILMIVSLYMKDISINRVLCASVLNFFMFPVLFWVTGGVNCGMVFYFMLGLSVSAITLTGKLRVIILILSMAVDLTCLFLGFQYPQLAYPLSYEERAMDTISSFLIVSFFIVAVILIMSLEYQKEHDKVLAHAEQLNIQANTDGLTSLYNHRFLLDYLETFLTSYDGTTAISLAIFDIDDFKLVNDRHGHLCGDQVLCRFASILRDLCGPGNIAARYGGEEFIAVFPNGARTDAIQCAENIRQAAFQDGSLKELVQGQFSISGGVAQFIAGMTIGEWINQADRNLYRAKEDGKNRIIG